MTVRLADLFDGKIHWLEPTVDFSWPVDLEVVDWEELDEEDELDDYETPACEPVLRKDRSKTSGTSKWPEDAQIRSHIGQGWSSFAVAMSAVMKCIGGDKLQYQYPKYDGTPDLFSFQFKPVEGGWQKGAI